MGDRCSVPRRGWDRLFEFPAERASTWGDRASGADHDRPQPPDACPAGRRDNLMLETIAIILLVLWLLGLVTGTTLGGFIYFLLVVAIVLFLVRIISGRRPV
jgi:hypothetical protein